MDRTWKICATLLAVAWLGGCAGQTERKANIAPMADQALRRMSTTLGEARSFRFQGEMTQEEPVETGHMAQFSRQAQVVVHRPDRLFVQTERGDDVWTLWYGGTSLTVYDKVGNAYASAQVPGRIDGMLEQAARKHGLTVPLADFLMADPYRALTTGVLTGKYVGQTVLDGVKTDHLLLTHDALDWQIWIEAGASAVPRRIVIDYKRLPGRPQFTAVLSDWHLSAPTSEEQFRPMVPAGATKATLAKLLGEAEGE